MNWSLFTPFSYTRGAEVELLPLLILVPTGGECSASRPGRFTSTEKVGDTEGTGGCVGPRCGLGVLEERKSLARARSDAYTYTYAPHNDVSVSDRPGIRWWSHKIWIL